MSIRISTNQIFDRAIQSVLENQGDLSDIQQQLSSGKKLLRPSDDPVGAAQVVRLTEDLDLLSQYQRNNELLQNALEQEEAVLQSINNAVNRARVLVIQAGNGILDTVDRQAVSIEIGQIRDEIFGLMNTQNANGEYIFAGYQSQSPAFTFDPTSPTTKYNFAGDDGKNRFQVSDTVFLQANSSGKEVFADVFARFDATITGSVGATSSRVTVTQQAAYDQFYRSNYDAVTAANNDYRITVQPGGTQVQISNIGTGTPVATLGFQSGQPFVFNGLEFTIDAAPGDTVDFELDAPEKKNLAETLNDFFNVLQNPNVSDSGYQEAINDALVGIDNGLLALANATSSLGGRLNVASSVFESNLDLEITQKDARSKIQDVNYAEAVSELARQETALEAAQATFARVTNLSLFDFIR